MNKNKKDSIKSGLEKKRVTMALKIITLEHRNKWDEVEYWKKQYDISWGCISTN